MKKVLGCFFQKSSHGNTAAPSLGANTPPYYKQSASRLNHRSSIFQYAASLILCLLLGAGNVWATIPTLDDLDFGTPWISENFSSSTIQQHSDASSNLQNLSGFGLFNKIFSNYVNNYWEITDTTNVFSGNKCLKLHTEGNHSNNIFICNYTFGQVGVWKIKTTKSSYGDIGIYGVANGSFANSQARVYIRNNKGVLKMSDGSTLSQELGTYTTDIIEICIIYNNSNSSITYGGNGDYQTTLGSNKAHVYVNGDACTSGGNIRSFDIPSNDITATGTVFKVTAYAAANANNYMYVDNLEIYKALPSEKCNQLDDINGSVSWTNPTTAVVSWDNIDNVDSWEVKYKKGSDEYSTWDGEQTVYTKTTTNDSRKVTITGLTPCANYGFQIIATPDEGYCENSETIEDDQTHAYSVDYSACSNVTKTNGATSVCGTEDFEATFTANSGFSLPDNISVSIGGVAQTQGEDFTWAIVEGVGTLTIDDSEQTGNIVIDIDGVSEGECETTPSLGTASLSGTFNLSSVGVSCASITAGDYCSVSEYGFIWYSGTGDKAIGDDGVTKVTNSTSYSSGSFSNTLSSTFTLGSTYTFRAYATNSGELTGYSSAVSFTPRSVTFDSNGGSTIATAYVNDGEKVSEPSDPTKTGYNFEGWYANEELETEWDFDDGVSDDDVTLYAAWEAKTTTITLDNQDATTAGEDEVTGTYDAALPSIAEDLPAKTGHTFKGYFDEEGGSGTKYYNADGSSAKNWDKEDATFTLYAYWTPNITVITFDHQCTESTGTTEANATYGETPPAITLPEREGYVFYEYRTAAGKKEGYQIVKNDGSWVNVTDYVVGGKWVYTAGSTVTLYAQWEPLYNVTWVVDGQEYDSEIVQNGKKVSTLPTPPTSLHESSDKIFAGWRSSEIDGSTDTDDTFYDVSGSPTITSDVTFYAVFGDRISTSAAAETVLWSENFSSYSADDVPSGSENTTNGNGRIVYNDGNVTYKCHDGILPTSTYVYDDSGNNQMRLGATNGIFKVGNISTAGATVAKLTYDKTLKQSVLSYLIKENGDSINIQLNSNANPAGTYSYTFNCNDFTTFAIGFKATTGNNVRLDNIVLEVERPSFEHLVTNSYHNDLSSDEESPEAMNWSSAAWAKGVVPTISDTVVLSNIAMTVDVNNAKASKVILKDNSTLTISAGKALVVKDNIRKWDGENYVATDEEDIIIGSTLGDGTGALVMGNYDGTNKATVNFATKAKKDASNHWINQFIGTPYNDETSVLPNYTGTQVYKFCAAHDGTYGGAGSEWTKLTGSDGMTPFMGYNLLRSKTDDYVLNMKGTLNTSSVSTPRVLNGYKGEADSTENMFANSWMAPIHIDEMETTDFSNMEATIYIFNAGTPEDQDDHSTADGSADNDEPGQYIVLPIKSSTWLSETAVTVIPAMQAFSVFAKGASPSLTLDYNKLVYEPALTSVGVVPTRAPKRTTEEAPEVIKLRVSAESGYAANTYLLGRSDFDEGFDNGWDGRYMEGDEEAPQLYIPSKSGNMVINCVPEIEGTVLAFRKGSKDNTYMFSFEYEGEENWYLNDTKEQSATLIAEDQTYRFESESSDNTARFVISQTPIKKTPTGVDSGGTAEIKAQKMMIDGVLYIIRAGKIYDATGVLVK